MMVVHDCEQGSEQWFAVRRGIPTASMFATVLAKGRDGRSPSLTRNTYLYKLAGEIETGEPMENYSNDHMARGHEMEDGARKLYALMTDAEPRRVGFISSGPKGCSPDSLIDEVGMLEIKTKLPHLAIECLLKDEFPPEHKAQCQGALWVAEREWIDLIVHWPKLPPFIKRAYRDEEYIKQLEKAVDQFNAELAQIVERVRRYGAALKAA